MERWEYLTEIVHADVEAEGVREYLKQRWPQWDPPRYTPEALLPWLNRRGAEGWELVQLQPVLVKPGGDIEFRTGESGWFAPNTNAYLCAFKRRLP